MMARETSADEECAMCEGRNENVMVKMLKSGYAIRGIVSLDEMATVLKSKCDRMMCSCRFATSLAPI